MVLQAFKMIFHFTRMPNICCPMFSLAASFAPDQGNILTYHVWCMLRSSRISRKLRALIARKRNEFLCFLLFWESFNCLWFMKHWSDSGGVFCKVYLSKWALQSNIKLEMSHVWLQTDFDRSRHIYHHVFTFFEYGQCSLW